MSITWRHQNADATPDGVAWMQAGQSFGTAQEPIVGGGWAHIRLGPNDETNDQTGLLAGQYPLVMSVPWYDSNTGLWSLMLGFAAPPRTPLRCHTWSWVQ